VEWLTKAGLNAVALSATVSPESLADGSYRTRIAVRGVTQRTVSLILRRWDDRKPSGEYVLCRVVRIEDNSQQNAAGSRGLDLDALIEPAQSELDEECVPLLVLAQVLWARSTSGFPDLN
jgi:hypothetical protein